MSNTINLTVLETNVFNLISTNRVSFFDDGLAVDSSTWLDVFTNEVASILGMGKQAVGGVISSLIQKGAFRSDGEALYLTEAGVALFNI